MIVQFSIVPLGKGASLSDDVSKVLKIVDKSGMPYKLTPMGTIVEGKWDDVMGLIKICHTKVLKNNERLVTTITIDDRKKKTNRIDGKVRSVEQKLNKQLRK